MDHQHLPFFMAYALFYKLAIIAVGAYAIYFGYRLFMLQPAAEGNAEMSATIAGNEFILKQAAPGTFFVLFGVIVVALMIQQGNPEFMLKEVKESSAQQQHASVQSADTQEQEKKTNALAGEVLAKASIPLHVRQLNVKSDDVALGHKAFEQALQQANQLYLSGQRKAALRKFKQLLQDKSLPLALAAYPLNALAWDALQQQQYQQAEVYSLLAMQIEADNGHFIDTFVHVAKKLGNTANINVFLTGLEARQAELAQSIRHKIQQ